MTETATTAVDLTGAIKERLDDALANGTPTIVAYVDADGRPHLSPRGSTHVHTSDELAIWARDPNGGLPRNVAERPQLTIWYRDPATRTTLQFFGDARIDPDESVRDAVYAGSAPGERDRDPEQLGVAVLVRVERVEGRDPNGPFVMARTP
jgi:Pyridoxamine 5'-phosphate oxidase